MPIVGRFFRKTPVDCQLLIAGDSALTVEFGGSTDAEIADRLSEFSARVQSAEIPGVLELLFGEATVTLLYDPLILSYARLSRRLRGLLRTMEPSELSSKAEETTDGGSDAEASEPTDVVPPVGGVGPETVAPLQGGDDR